MKGVQIDPPPRRKEKLPSKSPALLELSSLKHIISYYKTPLSNRIDFISKQTWVFICLSVMKVYRPFL